MRSLHLINLIRWKIFLEYIKVEGRAGYLVVGRRGGGVSERESGKGGKERGRERRRYPNLWNNLRFKPHPYPTPSIL